MQRSLNLGMYDSYQAEIFPLVGTNPCIFCQCTLCVCHFLDWVWFNCPELHHRVKTFPSVTLENIQIWSVLMWHWGCFLGPAAPKGAPDFLPVAVIDQAFLEVCLKQHSELTPPQFWVFSVITCAVVFVTQENQNIFPLGTHYRYSTWPALCVLRSIVTLSYLHSWTRIKAMNSFQSKPNLS